MSELIEREMDKLFKLGIMHEKQIRAALETVRRATFEDAALAVEHYATLCNDAEPGQHAQAACGFIAARLRRLA